MRGFRSARRVAKILLYLGLTFAVAAVIYLQTPRGRRSARDLIQSQASRLLQGELRIGRVDGALFTGVELSDVVLTSDGIHVVRIRNAHVRYIPLQILRGDSIVIDELSLRDVVVDGVTGLSRPIAFRRRRDVPRAPAGIERPAHRRRVSAEALQKSDAPFSRALSSAAHGDT